MRAAAALPALTVLLSGCSTLEAGPHAWFASAFGTATGQSSGETAATAAAPAAPVDTDTVGSAQVISRYIGSVAADDAQVVDIGRRVLESGGLAADAAAAMGMALTVSMPSRAGIDGSGVCVTHGARSDSVEEEDFIPPPLSGEVQIPGLVRGLADLQARYGRLRWQQSVGLAEQLAERGIAVTSTLLGDLVANGLSAEGPGGTSLKVGDVLPQTSVAAALSELRVGGASDFYTGASAAKLVAAGVPARQLAEWLPAWHAASGQTMGEQRVYFGGSAARIAGNALQALMHAQSNGPTASFAAARSAGAGLTDATVPTTSFMALDALGGGVSCALTMGKLFGTGNLLPDLDVYGAVPPSPQVQDALAPAIAVSGQQLTLVAGGSGSGVAAVDLAATVWQALAGQPVIQAVTAARVPTEGIGSEAHDRVNALYCSAGVPNDPRTCVAAYDPRGSGFAVSAGRVRGS